MSPLPLRLLGDERLGKLAARGDEGAFALLFGRHRSALLGYCRSLLRDDHDAQDALQNTALKALAGLPGRREGVPLRPWLFRIAHNEAITLLRRRTAASRLPDELAALADGPHEQAVAREELRNLIDDLGHLTERQRAALLLRQVGELDYDGIASVLETSPLAARQCVFAARRALGESAAGREASCLSVRNALSQEDRQALRTLQVRAHLRHCDDCRTFVAARPRRRSRAAALVPALSPSGLFAAVRTVFASGGTASEGLTAVPVTKAFAVAAAVAAGVGGASVATHHAVPRARDTVASVPARHAPQTSATASAVQAAAPVLATVKAPARSAAAATSAPRRQPLATHHRRLASGQDQQQQNGTRRHVVDRPSGRREFASAKGPEASGHKSWSDSPSPKATHRRVDRNAPKSDPSPERSSGALPAPTLPAVPGSGDKNDAPVPNLPEADVPVATPEVPVDPAPVVKTVTGAIPPVTP